MKQEEKASTGSSELQQPCGVVSSQAETSKPLGPHMDQWWPVGGPGRGVTSLQGSDS